MIDSLAMHLISPAGDRHDVSHLLKLEDLSELTETLEDDTAHLVHGDFDLTLKDPEGFWESALGGAEASDVWKLELDRKDPDARRHKWERLFGGILDVPWSVEVDRSEKLLSVQAFSFTKMLERFSAETISLNRDPAPGKLVGNTTAGSPTIGSDTLFIFYLRVGDTVTVTDGTNSETHTVAAVDALTADMVDDFVNTMTDAYVKNETPYPREFTIETIAALLFGFAGIDHLDFRIGNVDPSSVPFKQGWRAAGLATDNKMLTRDQANTIGNVLADTKVPHLHTWSADSHGGHNVSTGPESAWGADASGLGSLGDWTPYLATQPASLMACSTDTPELEYDIQKVGTLLTADDVSWNQCFDHTNSLRYSIYKRNWIIPSRTALHLRDNVTGFLHMLYRTAGGGSDQLIQSAMCEFIPAGLGDNTEDLVACSYMIPSKGGARLDFYRVTSNDSYEVTPGADDFGGGGVRCIKALGVVAVQSYGPDDQAAVPLPAPIRFFKPADGTAQPTLIKETPDDQPVMSMWTMRAFGDKLACLYKRTDEDGSAVWCRLWEWETLEEGHVADFEVHDLWPEDDGSIPVSNLFMTTFQLPDSDGQQVDFLVGIIKSVSFCIGPVFLGAVGYADFEGKSVAGALKELSLASLSYFTVDSFGTGTIVARNRLDTNASDLVDVGDHTIQPFSKKYYKPSVEVSGAEGITALAGETGKSADRLKIESKVIDTKGFAQAVGNAYAGVYGSRRRLDKATILSAFPMLHTLDLVRHDGKVFRVIEAETSVEDREQELTLLEQEADA